MSKDVWSDDVAYEFSIHRTFMKILAVWPLQKRTIFTTIHWNFVILMQLTVLIFVYLEAMGNNSDIGANIDNILYFVCVLSLSVKYICIYTNGSKLAKNINSVITDWSSAKHDEEAYKIMKKHAFKSRMFTLLMMYLCSIIGSLYILAVVYINLKDFFLQDQMDVSNGNATTKERIFMIACGELGDKITSLQYVMILIFQSIQILMITTMHSISDSFYINITLHFSGQLNVLKKKFEIFANKLDTQINYRKQFINLINRHCELMKLNQNLEHTFHLIILFQLIVTTLLVALLGLRIIVCFRNSEYVDLTKCSVLLSYLLLQSLVYCFGGEFVQKKSEGIFHAMFMASWFTLPATLMKDMNFAMMKSRYPFRLTGGKFFYVNLEVMVYILRTIASYLSVLRVALKN